MKSMIILFCFASIISQVHAQKINLQDKKQLAVQHRNSSPVNEPGKKGIKIDAGQGSAVMLLNDINFSDGIIELDLKGKNLVGQSFVGLAFHIQNDSTYDVIYFRPFNFANPDTIRRWRAVQYVSLPGYEWDKLRERFPGKYENKVNPVPDGDDWFHCRIEIKDKLISVYVNDSVTPSLVVNKLTGTTSGKMGLWVENGSEGQFANLEIRKR